MATIVFYQFLSIGEDDDAVEAEALSLEENDNEKGAFLFFSARPLTNLQPIHETESLAPVMDLKVAPGPDSMQFYAMCGRGPRSSLRLLRHGLKINDLAESQLPGVPNAIWTIRESFEDADDRFIIVSFENATLVLKVEDTVEEVQNSPFVETTKTFCVGQLSDGSVVQVHPNGYRRLARGLTDKTDWTAPTGSHVTHAAANSRQVLLVLNNSELVYFELGEHSAGPLKETTHKLGANVRISCVDVGDVPTGQLRAPYLALGYESRKVELLSLSPDKLFEKLGIKSFEHKPCSVNLSLSYNSGEAAEGGAPADGAGARQGTSRTFLSIGVHRGYLLRIEVSATGQLGDNGRVRYLGKRPVKLVRVNIAGQAAVLALSSRSWLLYNHQQQFFMTPFSYPALDYACNLRSEQVSDGMVAIAGNLLRVIAVDQLGGVFNQKIVPLTHTPRKAVVETHTGNLIVIETDHNAFTEKETLAIKGVGGAPADERDGNSAEVEGEDGVDVQMVGADIPNQPGKWASCIRVLDIGVEDPANMTTTKVELEDNEAAFSMCIADLQRDIGGHTVNVKCLVVGTAKDLQLHPRSVTCGYIHVYTIVYEGKNLNLRLQHKTKVEDIPYALCAFHGKLLASCGHSLRLYGLGKNKLLKKGQNNNFPFFIATIHTLNRRIYVGDLNDSVIFCKHRVGTNELAIFADEIVPRSITCGTPLDYDTYFGADKFGNIFASRLPEDANEDIINPTGNRILWDAGRMNGAPNKLENVMNFHVGETVTTCVKTKLSKSGEEVVLLGTIMGSLSAVMPFRSSEKVDFFSQLELHMRNEQISLVGRDQLSYRSYFVPVKCVIDGDLCEAYTRLPADRQRHVANEMNSTPGKIVKNLEDVRNRIL